VPPLRERGEDIELLVNKFVDLYSKDIGGSLKSFDAGTIEALKKYLWPGNVRELKNLVERLLIMTPGSVIKKTDLPPDILGKDTKEPDFENYGTLKDARNAFEKAYIVGKLAENSGNISRTAEAIGLERSNLHKKIKLYELDVD